MRSYGLAQLSDFLGDRVAYRSLQPYDPSLPQLGELRGALGLAPGVTPRKNEPDYARVVAQMLQAARRQDGGPALQRVIFIGDTRLLDATAFTNLCAAGGWPGLAFIGSETGGEAQVTVEASGPGSRLYLSNRWAALADFDRFCADQGLPVDERAVVVVDLDKTALGARGRNAAVIDAARVDAVR
ncbi:MAG: hypothetical protein ACKOC5_03110, partial [Chloroflexota bacterium]